MIGVVTSVIGANNPYATPTQQNRRYKIRLSNGTGGEINLTTFAQEYSARRVNYIISEILLLQRVRIVVEENDETLLTADADGKERRRALSTISTTIIKVNKKLKLPFKSKNDKFSLFSDFKSK